MCGIKDFSLATNKGLLLKNASSYIMEKDHARIRIFFRLLYT